MKLVGIATLITFLVHAQTSEFNFGDYATDWDQLCSNHADIFPFECEVSNLIYFNISECPVI